MLIERAWWEENGCTRRGEGRLNRSGGGNKKIPQYACCHKCKQNAGACYTRMEIKIIA